MASTQYTESVELFRGVPFDTSYVWTLAPMPVSLKLSWLEENCSYDTYNKLMHTKMNTVTGSGALRLEIPNDAISTYNYVYVQSSHEPAYFAFILGYTYINDGKEPGKSVYELAIQKDVLMSNLTDEGDFKDCVILRHHSTNRFDNPWPPEDFGGTIVNLSYKEIPVETHRCYAVVQYIETTQEFEFSKVEVCSTTASAVPQGCVGGYFQPDDTVALSNFIKDNAKEANNVNAIYMVPKFLLAPPGAGGAYLVDENVNRNAVTVEIETDAFDDHDTAVVNRKCYYYPYDFLRFYNDAGQTMDLRWEWWRSKQGLGTKQVAVEGIAVPPVSVTCHPIGYLGAPQGQVDVYGEHYPMVSTHCLTMSNYPVGSWLNDSYSAAVGAGRIVDAEALLNGNFKQFGRSVLNKVTSNPQAAAQGVSDSFELVSNVSSFAQSNLGMKAGGAGALGVAVAVGAKVLEETEACMAAGLEVETLSGSTGSNSASYTNGHKRFYYSHMCLNGADRMALDSYFNKFGYNQGGVIAKPDPFGRENSKWCYIKTAGITYVTPAANANEQTIINNAFNRGITLWMNNNTAATIGDYDQYNGEDTIPFPQEAADEYFGIANS